MSYRRRSCRRQAIRRAPARPGLHPSDFERSRGAHCVRRCAARWRGRVRCLRFRAGRRDKTDQKSAPPRRAAVRIQCRRPRRRHANSAAAQRCRPFRPTACSERRFRSGSRTGRAIPRHCRKCALPPGVDAKVQPFLIGDDDIIAGAVQPELGDVDLFHRRARRLIEPRQPQQLVDQRTGAPDASGERFLARVEIFAARLRQAVDLDLHCGEGRSQFVRRVGQKALLRGEGCAKPPDQSVAPSARAPSEFRQEESERPRSRHAWRYPEREDRGAQGCG